ncbi:MAG: MFS transporter, partial [Candidatus Lokiarchaeota archaeon]|nr:MFS transporter [Candidatus Lokiarchaeota archaeon]MBD3198825.1 MFS transporter [Candidatus Lokiarchaeota archaeon]
MKNENNEKFKIDLKTKVQFALGGIGFNLSAGFFAAWLLNFYIKVVKLDPLLWGLAWALYVVWNAVNDPLMGYLGDQTRTRFGRRVPWLMVATPFISIAFFFLFFPPLLDPTLISSQWIYFLWLFLFLLSYDTFYTIIGITQKALVAELSILPEERASSTFFWSFGTLFGQVTTFVIPFLFIVNEDPYTQNLPTFQFLVILFAIIGALFLGMMSFGIKEKKEFVFAEKKKMKFIESIKYTIKNNSFIIYTLFSFTLVFMNSMIYSQISFFVQDVLQVSSSSLLSSVPILVFIGASLVGYPIGLFFNKKFGGKRGIIYLSVIVIFGLVFLTLSFEYITSNLALLIIGIGYSGMGLIAPILMADIIDLDELKTGYRREGAYYGSNNLFTKPAQSLAAGLTSMVFILTGYDQFSSSQSILAQFGIKLNIGIIPAIIIAVGILILTKFPIDGSTEDYNTMKLKVEK